jgi:haloalkane dehalogenase
MRHIATLEVPLHNGVPGATPYREVVVRRRNSFTWSKRYPVYELTAPSGRTYVMQSFARIRDPRLELSDLRTLGSRLQLPAGWRFRERRLKHDLTLTVTRRAIVVQDELMDTYQLVTRAG